MRPCRAGWEALRGDPLPWLLDTGRPNLHWRVLLELIGRPPDSPAVRRARGGANAVGPVAALLADLHPDGTWATPARSWARYAGTGWRLAAAVAWGADPEDPRLHAGADTLEAAVSGVNLVEEDPSDMSVGYGGLPNFEGVVQLDSSVMHGPSRGAGAVAALEGIKRPSRVAMDVMRYTDHVLLVGEGAQRFATSMGHPVENLLTDEARRRWIEWRARLSDSDTYMEPGQLPGPVEPFKEEEDYGDPLLDSHDGVRPLGTINCNA